ncbi:MAG: hypothetical protein NZ517_00005, partial [Candidatus Nitrosocaldus sp.]|nr:hypothetical protein [Candidatus Nitrosocaldus sp.]
MNNYVNNKDWFWRRVIEGRLIDIPTGDRWVTERINYRALTRQLSTNFKTADMLSIDNYERLPHYLRRLDCGVIRLGIQKNTAEFVLCKPAKGAHDLYLFDDMIFATCNNIGIMDNVVVRLLQRIDRLDEGSGLNIFSHIFPFKVIFNTDTYRILSFPYKTNPRFKFLIEDGLGPVEFINGQVEVDSNVLLITEDNKYRVVVIEAKFSSNNSIAKHKLLYPTMVATKLFPDAEVIP